MTPRGALKVMMSFASNAKENEFSGCAKPLPLPLRYDSFRVQSSINRVSDGTVDVPARHAFDDRSVGWVLLPNDRPQCSGVQSVLNELLIDAASFNGLVLVCVAGENHAIRWAQVVEEGVHPRGLIR
jgi:hypothetical protein